MATRNLLRTLKKATRPIMRLWGIACKPEHYYARVSVMIHYICPAIIEYCKTSLAHPSLITPHTHTQSCCPYTGCGRLISMIDCCLFIDPPCLCRVGLTI
jgi:hypothetical protein